MTSYVSPVAFTTVAQSIPPNVFADMDRKVAAAVAGGADVIDLAKGNPDAFPADFIREVAKKAVDDPANARYSPFDGKPSFLRAAEQWYRNTYGVEVDWKTQLFAVEGAVDGLAALFAVLVSPGDAVAYADPYYPSYHCMTVMSRAEEILLPSLPERGFLPDLDAVPAQVWDRVKVLVLNYPNNPTGAQAPREFLQHAVDLAHEYHFAIVQDFAYAGLGVDAQQISILSLPGAFDVAVEVCSLSKMYAMAGCRPSCRQRRHRVSCEAVPLSDGFLFPSLRVAHAGGRLFHADSGPVMSHPSKPFTVHGGSVCFRRFRTLGRAPEDQTGEQFADTLLERAAVAALPGTCFGKVGKDYVRFSLLKSEDQLREAVRRVAAVLA